MPFFTTFVTLLRVVGLVRLAFLVQVCFGLMDASATGINSRLCRTAARSRGPRRGCPGLLVAICEGGWSAMRCEVKRPGRSEGGERGLDWAWLMALEEYIAHFLLRWEVAPTSDGVQMEMDRGRSEQQFNLTTYGPQVAQRKWDLCRHRSLPRC